MTIKSLFIVFLILLLSSCDLLTEDTGGGIITVTMDGEYYELTNVRGYEYLGFYCGGKLRGKQLSLALGHSPKTGDTLHFSDPEETYHPVYCAFNYSNAIKNSGNIIIIRRSGTFINGLFSFSTIIENDTIIFSDGSFRVTFPPSK